jgi:hypothetical protein
MTPYEHWTSEYLRGARDGFARPADEPSGADPSPAYLRGWRRGRALIAETHDAAQRFAIDAWRMMDLPTEPPAAEMAVVGGEEL